ncbi:ComEC/Rec2 family competence protein [Brevundimonas pishanensis]|uniref:ComEC/Rec2 family competence protein n=1 Tax=Brevundimonas pishanensis TaxID=2896315 RepID=UPI001FA7ED8F|nr:ComEC/Rec2 family competence protein [Brevundimonas pishanensis]
MAQSDRWPLWSAVCFGAGCASYFWFRTEPPLWPLLIFAALSLLTWGFSRVRGAARSVTLPLLMLACMAGGLATAKARSDAVAAPIAPSMGKPTLVEAYVIDVDSPGARGHRVILAPVRIRGLEPEQVPHRVRATVKGEPPRPGEAVTIFGLLNPPPAPASPGSYDFGRGAWFESMGGVLFGLTEARSADLAEPPYAVRQEMRINAIRFALAERLVARLGEQRGGIAAAMVTGHETWIGADDLQAMRDSGLAHILSISGLHMAVVGGFVFFLIRLLVALVPWLALRASGKKIAAVAGLLAVGAYLLLSGAPAPAERAAVTAAIAFGAILLNRKAISMRALATAAFVVLLLQPEAVITPGFQMSFAATAALVALAEIWPRRIREINTPWPIAALQRALSWGGTAIAASLVAGLATGPFVMHHFNRTSVYGLVANMASAPLADLIMLPALALGAVLEPFGLGGPFLWVAGVGVEAMLAVGHWAASLPGAVQTMASAPAIALPVAFIGVLFMCLWRGWLRLLGLPMACAVLLWPRPEPPSIWIGEAATNAAWVEGQQATVFRHVRAFASQIWAQRWNLEVQQRDKSDWTCGRTHCHQSEGIALIALWWGRAVPATDKLEAMCMAAEVVAVRSVVADLPAACSNRLVLDGHDFAEGGAVQLWRDPSGWRAKWVRDTRGVRPWSRWGDPDYQ